MPIYNKGINIDCTKSTPAALTQNMMSDKLHNVGLNCEYTEPDNVKKLMDSVSGTLPVGYNESFYIQEHSDENTFFRKLFSHQDPSSLNVLFLNDAKTVDASWRPSSTALGHMALLCNVIAPSSYWWLSQRYADFAHHETGPKAYTETQTSMEAIKNFFGTVLATAASSIVGNLALDDIKAVCTRMLPPMPEQKDNYHDQNSFNICILDNYDSKTRQADGIGMIALEWDLTVSNYKKDKKDSPKHDALLALNARSVIYDDITVLKKHSAAVENLVKHYRMTNYLAMKKNMHQIHTELPAPSIDALMTSIPMLSDSKTLRSLVLYQPEEKCIGEMDNRHGNGELDWKLDLEYGIKTDCSLPMLPGLRVEVQSPTTAGTNVQSHTFDTDTFKNGTAAVTYKIPAGKHLTLFQRQLHFSILEMDIETGRSIYTQEGILALREIYGKDKEESTMEKTNITITPIVSEGIEIDCIPSKAAELTTENLQKQLNQIGLTCKYTDIEHLEKIKKEVEQQLKTGSNEAFGIYHLQPAASELASVSLKGLSMNKDRPFLEAADKINGSWEPSNDNALGYIQKLSVILSKINFDKIKQHFPDFSGLSSGPSESQSNESTLSAIKNFFVTTLNTACGSVVEGLVLDDMEAICTNMFPADATADKDYHCNNSFIIALLNNYSSEEKQADGVGAIYMNWELSITNYMDKKDRRHRTNLTLTVRSVMYDDAVVLNNHYKFITQMIKSTYNQEYQIPPVTGNTTIFDKLPPATFDTFNQGIPEKPLEGKARVIILYGPDLTQIAMVDNTSSSAAATYSVSVATGFSQSDTISFGEELNMEAGCEFVKMGVKITMNLSFTSESSVTSTETVSYTVPGGETAYLYQGYLQYAVLSMDMETGRLSYTQYGKYDSKTIKTSVTPL